jgi:tetratricopeptide (TPR) repeat protein
VLSQADERIGSAAQELGYLNEALRALREDETLLAELLQAEPLSPALHRREALLHFYRSTVYYSDFFPSLDDAARGLDSARRYLAAAEEMVRSDPTNATARFSRAIATGWRSVPLRQLDPRAAVPMAEDSVRLFDELAASGKPSYLITSRRVRALEWLGEAQLKAGRAADARRTAETALAAERPILSASADQEERVLLVQLLILAGNAHAAENDFERAESLLREARQEAQALAARRELANIVPLARAEDALGAFYVHRGRTEEARACFRRLADLWRQFPGPNEYVDRQRSAAERLLASLG